ncbi:MAG: Crp/Fnr family transcriptional regulator [Winogradskyella arenosi]
MKQHHSIIQEIFKGVSLSDDELDTIAFLFKKETHKKGTIIFKANAIVSDQYYIYEGCLRTYHIDAAGKEHTVQFGIKDWWITDFIGYFSNSKAMMSLEVIEDAIVYKISNKDKDYLYTNFPPVQNFIVKKLEGAYAAFQKRIIVSLSESAKERYLIFLDTHCEIEKRLKNYHIASYLGITTESLSRIRKELYSS